MAVFGQLLTRKLPSPRCPEAYNIAEYKADSPALCFDIERCALKKQGYNLSSDSVSCAVLKYEGEHASSKTVRVQTTDPARRRYTNAERYDKGTIAPFNDLEKYEKELGCRRLINTIHIGIWENVQNAKTTGIHHMEFNQMDVRDEVPSPLVVGGVALEIVFT
jgi:hypothetical protein